MARNDGKNICLLDEFKDIVASSKSKSEICEKLKERGYDPTNQMVGYILSGDLGYISNYKSENFLEDYEDYSFNIEKGKNCRYS